MEQISNRLRAFCSTIKIVEKLFSISIFSQNFLPFKFYFTRSYFAHDKFAVILILSKVTVIWIVFIPNIISLLSTDKPSQGWDKPQYITPSKFEIVLFIHAYFILNFIKINRYCELLQ